MARKTIATLEAQIADLTRWHDDQAERIRELLIDLDNANNEIARLREQLSVKDEELAGCQKVIADQHVRHDKLGRLYNNKATELDNALAEIEILTGKLEKSERLTERAEPIPARPAGVILPDKPKRGRKPKADPETRAYIHALRAAVDGEGRPYNSLSQIAEHTGISKTQVFAILQEPEPVGKWYSTKKDGSRVYYKDYRSAIRSKNDIHFDADQE